MLKNKYDYIIEKDKDSYYIQLYFRNESTTIQIQTLNTVQPKFWKEEFEYKILEEYINNFSYINTYDQLVSTLTNFFEKKEISINKENDKNKIKLIIFPQCNDKPLYINKLTLPNMSNQINQTIETNIKTISLCLLKMQEDNSYFKNKINKLESENQLLKQEISTIKQQIFYIKNNQDNYINQNNEILDINKNIESYFNNNQNQNEKNIIKIKNAVKNIYDFLKDNLNSNDNKKNLNVNNNI